MTATRRLPVISAHDALGPPGEARDDRRSAVRRPAAVAELGARLAEQIALDDVSLAAGWYHVADTRV